MDEGMAFSGEQRASIDRKGASSRGFRNCEWRKHQWDVESAKRTKKLTLGDRGKDTNAHENRGEREGITVSQVIAIVPQK
jgi:hypothetical protein